MTQQKEVPEKILAKIQKLLKLQESAEKIHSEGEAFHAASAVRRLLTEYNLQLADVIESGEKPDIKMTESKRINYDSDFGSTWKRTIMATICKYNYCQTVQVRFSTKMFIIGMEDNVNVCKSLYDYLTKTARRLAGERFEAVLNIHPHLSSFKDKRTFIRSYLEGFAWGLNKNFQEHQPTSKETGLMVCHNELINQHLKDKYGGSSEATPQSRNHDRNLTAFMFGHNDGRNVGLNKQID